MFEKKEIMIHTVGKKAFDTLGVTKIPRVKESNQREHKKKELMTE